MSNIDLPPGLPASVQDLAHFGPIEDIALHVLRQAMPDVSMHAWVEDVPKKLFILARRAEDFGYWSGDPRFIDVANLKVDVFTQDPDGDEKGALVAEAVRAAFRNASVGKLRLPNGDSIQKIRMLKPPSQKSDWMTAEGPVQYAELPAGSYRYEAVYRIHIRKHDHY